MRHLTFLPIVLMIIAGPGIAQEGSVNNCAECHSLMGAPYDSLVQAQQSDVHARSDITCTDCHGGDPTVMDMEAAKGPETGFLGKPEPGEIPGLCGECHADPTYMRQYDPGLSTDQLTQYWTSTHGILLKEGDSKVAQCASCHGAHGVESVKLPGSRVYPLNVPKTCNECHGDQEYMASYEIPTDQYQEYSRSVHGKALLQESDTGAPACNDCHGNHGAQPPGLESISQVCGTCHVNNQNLFEESLHQPIFDQMGIPECEVCHGNHEVKAPTDEMIGTGTESVCLQCHVEGDAGYRMAAKMSASIDSIKTVHDSAQVMIQEAARKSMETSDLRYELRNVRQRLIRTRTMIHSFDLTRIEDVEQEGLSTGREIIQEAKALISEYYYRRRGLGIFTLIITGLAIVLYLKIRQIERNQPDDDKNNSK